MGDVVDISAWRSRRVDAELASFYAMVERDLIASLVPPVGYVHGYGLSMDLVPFHGPPLAPLIDILTAKQSPSLPAQPEDHPVRAAAQVLDWFDRQP